MKKGKKKLLFVIITVIIGVGALSTIMLYPTPTEGETFNLPSPNSLTPNPSITCNMNAVVTSIDSQGHTIFSTVSSTKSDNPVYSLDLSDPKSGKVMAGYVTHPVIRCNASNSLTIAPSSMTVTVYATTESGSNVKIKHINKQSPKITIPAGDTSAKKLGNYGIYDSEIEDKIGGGDYNSVATFYTSGVLEMYWTGYPSIIYYYQVNHNEVPVQTTFTVFDPNKITSDSPQDQGTLDDDQDGIINKLDSCPSQKEVFNGYQDGDGCPDTNPNDDSTDSNETANNTPEDDPIDTDAECQAEHGSGYIYDAQNKLCIPPPPSDQLCGVGEFFIDGGCVEACVDGTNGGLCSGESYFDPGNECDGLTGDQCFFKLFNEDSTSTNVSGGLSENVGIVLNMEVTYADGSKVSKLFPVQGDSYSTLFTNTLTGAIGTTDFKAINEIKIEGFTKFANEATAKKFSLSNSAIKFEPKLRIAGTDIELTPRQQTGATQNSATLLFGSSSEPSFYGFSLGQVTLTSSEIHGAIQNTNVGVELVPKGQERTLILRVDVTGPAKIHYLTSDGQQTLSGTLANAYVEWSNLKIVNPVTPKTSTAEYDTYSKALIACGSDSNVKAVSGGGFTCVEQPPDSSGNPDGNLNCGTDQQYVVVGGVGKCQAVGTTPDDGDGTPTIGEPGVEVCTDDDRPGGFPCTSDYRDVWCNGGNECDEPPTSNKDPRITPTPVDGEKTNDCSLQQASILDNLCTSGDPKDADSGDSIYCTSAQDCRDRLSKFSFDDPMIIIIGLVVALIVVGGLIYLITKPKNRPLRSRYR